MSEYLLFRMFRRGLAGEVPTGRHVRACVARVCGNFCLAQRFGVVYGMGMNPKDFKRQFPLRSRRITARRVGTAGDRRHPLYLGPLMVKLAMRYLPGDGYVLSTAPWFCDLELFLQMNTPRIRVLCVFPLIQNWHRGLVEGMFGEWRHGLDESFTAWREKFKNPTILLNLRNAREWVLENRNLFGYYMLSQVTDDGTPGGRIIRGNVVETEGADYDKVLSDVRDQIVGMRTCIDERRFILGSYEWETDVELVDNVGACARARRFTEGASNEFIWFHDMTAAPVAPGMMAVGLKAIGDRCRFIGIVSASYFTMLEGECAQYDVPVHGLQADKISTSRMSEIVVVSNREF